MNWRTRANDGGQTCCFVVTSKVWRFEKGRRRFHHQRVELPVGTKHKMAARFSRSWVGIKTKMAPRHHQCRWNGFGFLKRCPTVWWTCPQEPAAPGVGVGNGGFWCTSKVLVLRCSFHKFFFWSSVCRNVLQAGRSLWFWRENVLENGHHDRKRVGFWI